VRVAGVAGGGVLSSVPRILNGAAIKLAHLLGAIQGWGRRSVFGMGRCIGRLRGLASSGKLEATER